MLHLGEGASGFMAIVVPYNATILSDGAPPFRRRRRHHRRDHVQRDLKPQSLPRTSHPPAVVIAGAELVHG